MKGDGGSKRERGRPHGSGKNRTFRLIGSFDLTFEQALAGIELAIRRMSPSQYLEYMDRLAQCPPDQVEFGEPTEPLTITGAMEFYFVRVRLADGFAYHLGTRVGDAISLVCRSLADPKDMEAISAKAGGVSCPECARRAAELSVPVVVQLEELPVEAQQYDSAINVTREARRVARETNERLTRLQNLFVAAGGSSGP